MIGKNIHCIQNEIAEAFISTKTTNQNLPHLKRQVNLWLYLQVANLNTHFSIFVTEEEKQVVKKHKYIFIFNYEVLKNILNFQK